MRRRAQFSGAGGGGVAAHNLLSAVHPDTVVAGPVRGDLVIASAVPDWQRFARGAAGDVLTMNPAATDPIWSPSRGFIMHFRQLTLFNPADLATYLFGGNPRYIQWPAVWNHATLDVPKACIATRCQYRFHIDAVLGTAEDVNIDFWVNNAFGFGGAVTQWNAAYPAEIAVVFGFAQPLALGDLIEVRIQTPAWVTNPTGVSGWAQLYCE